MWQWYFQIRLDPLMSIPPRAARLTKEKTAFDWVRFCLWGLIGLACAMQAYEIRNRGIDPDELEHLHAAYCVSRGQVPYREFFEHHGPAQYYVVLPLFALCGPQLSVLWLGRLAMWCCSLAALFLTRQLARRWAGDRAGLLAMALLAWTTVFHAKGIELRPDVPAMLLLILAVGQFTYATGGGSWRRFLFVGLLAGMAMLFTQKSLVPAAGITLAACLARLLTREPHSESAETVLARVIVPTLAGIALVWGIAALLFATAGAAGDFWYSTWYQLWIWPVRSSRWEHLRPTLAGDLTVWVAALIDIGALLTRFRASESWKEQSGVVAVIAAVCIISLTFVKATYAQYYLLWMPFLAALAARRLIVSSERVGERGMFSLLIIAAVGMSYGAWRNVQTARWSNAEQVTAIEAVNRHVSPDGRVLDGFTGYGVLRPHAWYYWWINEYSLALIPQRDREAGLLHVLEESPPAAVLFDSNLELLPRRVVDWIEAHYEPADPAVLWLPRERRNGRAGEGKH
jgi:4-amino-4-deoxy-L-arabinose transferase-like glycosyltransferase